MQMVRAHIARHDTERKKDEKIDLDEKIRRIREQNKARERRFKEVEDDKMQASSDVRPARDTRCDVKQSSPENERRKIAMKGVVATNRRKVSKGRGQRLLEMSQEPLKAGEFESKARQTLKILDGKSCPKESKLWSNDDLSTEGTSRPKEHNFFTNQSVNDKREVLSCSDIPSSGYNPLIDDRYIDKPKENHDRTYLSKEKVPDRRHGGFGKWNKMDMQVKHTKNVQRGKWDKFTAHRQEEQHRAHEEARSSGWTPMKTNVRQENTVEDWSTEVMNVDESKVEFSIDETPAVRESLQEQVEADLHCDGEEKKDVGLCEDIDIEKNNTVGHDECNVKPGVDEISEVCQRLQAQLSTIKHEYDNDDKNEQVPQDNVINEEGVSLGECFTEETLTGVLQDNDSKHDTISAAEDKMSETKSKRQLEKKPKITINTKLKKTPSSSSFDEVMSMLSPLDVPTNWGDCDDDQFSGDNFEPIF